VCEIAADGGIIATLASFNHADRAYGGGILIAGALVLSLRAGKPHGAIVSQKGGERRWVFL
jgi:hypothetical protein